MPFDREGGTFTFLLLLCRAAISVKYSTIYLCANRCQRLVQVCELANAGSISSNLEPFVSLLLSSCTAVTTQHLGILVCKQAIHLGRTAVPGSCLLTAALAVDDTPE